jgi:hypothetical protein
MKNQEEVMSLISQIFEAIHYEDMKSDVRRDMEEEEECYECGYEECMCDDEMCHDEEDGHHNGDPMKKGVSITMIKKSKKNPYSEEY